VSDTEHLERADPPVRVGGLAAMRALAHPTRVRMMQILRTESLSASELARRLDIRFGSAHYHLRTLEEAGIVRRGDRRRNRGGTEILFEVPDSMRVDLDADAPREMREAVYRAYLAELGRRLDASAAEPEPEDTDRDVLTTREVELRPDDLPAATEALHAFLRRLDELALDRPGADTIPFTVAVQLFRVPRSAAQHASPPGEAR
jgi:DNA-binding transcriptional ArsR family regulator